MKKEEELLRDLGEMIKETKVGKLEWEVQCQTTEYNETKPVVEEDGKQWTVDECYVLYHCQWKGEEFLMITYEMLHTSDKEQKSTNLVFLPPLGMRYFDIHALLPYSIEASNMLIYQIHALWEQLLESYKGNPDQIKLQVLERTLTIEE